MLKTPTVLDLDRYEYAAARLGTLRQSLSPQLVFDVGAGDGSMRSHLNAIDLPWRAFDRAPANPDVVEWNLDEPCPLSESPAGMVLLLEVIEHLTNPGLALRNLANILPRGGRLLITTPNPRWSRSRLQALRTGFLTCFTQDDLDRNFHIFPVWPHVLERLLVEAGFDVEEYCTLDGATKWPQAMGGISFPLRVVHAALNKWIERIDPSACGMSYGILARRVC